MFVAYLTHDEVNAAAALRIAARLGLPLVVIDVRDRRELAAADRLVCDLDHLPADFKDSLLARAVGGQELRGVAAHSYHLTGREAALFRRAGASVSRRLNGRLFRAASRAAKE